MKVDDEYIGDGLYASFDGCHFVLRAQRENGEHWVGLEPEVLHRFNQYAEKVKQILKSRAQEEG